MASSDQFNVRWNNHTSVLQNVFCKLLEGEQFVDVTLACEGQSIKCHRLILSACSTYFDRILTDNPSSKLVIYLTDMKFWELSALVTFMYSGEVSVSQQKLPDLFKAAETLKVKGLAHGTSLKDGDMDRLDEDELDNYGCIEGKKCLLEVRNTQAGGLTHYGQQQKSFSHLQYNNLSAYADTQANRQPQQIKRNFITQTQPQPPKLVKMQSVEQKSSYGAGVAAGSFVDDGNLKMLVLPVKKPDTVEMSRASVSRAMENYENEEEDSMQHDVIPDSSFNDEGDVGDGGDNEKKDSGDENEHLGSDIDDSQLGEVMTTLRQYLQTYGIPKKTLSKLKIREAKQDRDEDATSPNRTNGGGEAMRGGTVVLQPMGAPVNSADRAERYKKAAELAMNGATVRGAAAQFEIPRTTLCAYMKRRGLAPKRNIFPFYTISPDPPTI